MFEQINNAVRQSQTTLHTQRYTLLNIKHHPNSKGNNSAGEADIFMLISIKARSSNEWIMADVWTHSSLIHQS